MEKKNTKHVRIVFPRIKIHTNTVRPKEVPEEWPKFVLGGFVGVNSVCANEEVKDDGEADWDLIHSSQSWFTLDKAVLKRSACHNWTQSLITNQLKIGFGYRCL